MQSSPTSSITRDEEHIGNAPSPSQRRQRPRSMSAPLQVVPLQPSRPGFFKRLVGLFRAKPAPPLPVKTQPIIVASRMPSMDDTETLRGDSPVPRPRARSQLLLASPDFLNIPESAPKQVNLRTRLSVGDMRLQRPTTAESLRITVSPIQDALLILAALAGQALADRLSSHARTDPGLAFALAGVVGQLAGRAGLSPSLAAARSEQLPRSP